MKTKIVIFISIYILLASCAPSTSTLPPVTNMPVSTTVPTNIPTITFTPTATLDPNAPEGTRESDAEGEYIEMENGDIARKVEYITATGEALWTGWAIEKTQPGGIPLLDIGELNAVQTRLLVQPNIPGSENILSLTHPDNLESSTGDNALSGVVSAALQTRMNILGDNTKVTPWFKQVSSGTATLPIITSTGDAVHVLLGPKTAFVTIVVPYESLDPSTVAGVTEWKDPYSESRKNFRSTVLGVDVNGNAICLIGSEEPLDTLPDKVIRLLSLWHAGNMINDPAQTTQEWSDWLSVFVTYADAKGNKKVPDIIIIRRQ